MLKKLSVFISFLFFLISVNSVYSQRLIRLGQEEIKNKNYSEAILFLSDAIKKYPKVQNGYYLLAIAYRENNQLTEAEGALLDGIAVGGDIDYKLYFELGNIMFKRGEGYYNLAIRYYSSSVKQMTNYDKSLLNRANSYVEQGKITEKERDYKSAWDAYTMAIHDYSQFITLKPETEKKNDILYMIELLRNKKADLEELDTSLKSRDGGGNGSGSRSGGGSDSGQGQGNRNNKITNELENKSNTDSLIELEKINWQEELNIDE